MKKNRLAAVVLLCALFLSLVGCDRTKVFRRQDEVMTLYFQQAEAAARRFYPECRPVPSPDNERKDPGESDYYRHEYYSIYTPEDTRIDFEAYFDSRSRWYSVTMTRDFQSAEEKGFHTKDLTLFCELTNLIPLLSDDELDRATCRDLINEKRGYSTKYDDDSFVPVERELRTGHNLILDYTITDHKAGGWPDDGFTEYLESTCLIETDWLFPSPYR